MPVPEEQPGTGTETIQNDPEADAIEEPGTPTETSPEAPTEQSFFDPNQVPEELKPVYKKMQASFTKKMQKFRADSEKAGMVDRFNSDPNYAIATIQNRAQQLGFSLTKGQAQNIATATSAGVSVPSSLVQTIASRLSPELAWMAPQLAEASWLAQQEAVAPLKAQQEQDRKNQRDEEYDGLVSDMDARFPGWEEHEDEMTELLHFMESPKMRHRMFGSKLELLHNIVTKNASAISEAQTRMSNAARARTITGLSSRSVVSNTENMVRKAKTNQEAWDIAKKAAAEELSRQ